MFARSLPWLLLAVAIASRALGVLVPGLGNFSPFMALTFCTALAVTRKSLWLVPVAGLGVSDGLLALHYALPWEPWSIDNIARYAAAGGGLALGSWASRRLCLVRLALGAFGCSIIFYFGTNTASWFSDPFYAKTAGGWVMALTVGHPEFPPTWVFFRNTFVSDQLFTALFACVWLRTLNQQRAPARETP